LHKEGAVPSVDAVIASPPLAGLARVTRGGGSREIRDVRLAEQFADLGQAPAGSVVVLGRHASAEATDYRFDMGLRWAAGQGVAAVAAFSGTRWRPTATAADIAERAGLALIWIPAQAEVTWLIRSLMREIGGTAEVALARAEAGITAVTRLEQQGASLAAMCQSVSQALGTPVEFTPEPGPAGAAVVTSQVTVGYLAAPEATGDLAVAARIVVHAAAAAAARIYDAERRSRELPVRSRGQLLAELLMSEAALGEDLLDRARQLGVPLTGWHVAVRIEADNLDDAGRDEVHRFELLESAGQVALQAVTGLGTWYLSGVSRAVMLICMSASDPGPQAGARAARAAERVIEAAADRLPRLRLRAGVGAAHQGPLGLRASAAEARAALAAARAAGRADPVAAHDATGVQRMLLEWYASDSARSSVRELLAPLERLGAARAETAIRTLAVYLEEQGSAVRAAQKLHLHRNAVAYRLRQITDLLAVDLGDCDQRLALQLACRARLLQ
jgi:sugar diacid utilization regulator